MCENAGIRIGLSG